MESTHWQGCPAHSQIEFTCVKCDTTQHIKFDNAIFRTVETFCSKCGSGWKVTNPMFAGKTGKQAQQG